MNKTLILQAPVALCRLLSPYTAPEAVKQQLDTLLEQPELLDRVIECANQHMVVATLYACLREHRQLERLPETLRDYLHYQHTFMQARNQRLRTQALSIITALHQVSVTPLLMKGGDTLFYALYPDQGCRFMTDLDILLPTGTMTLAQQTLATQGYAIPEQYQHLQPSPLAHHDLPLYKTGHDCAIELHYQPLSHRSGAILNNDSAFASSRLVSLQAQAGTPMRSLSPTHKVLHSFIHSEISHGDDQNNGLSIRQLDYFVRLLQHYQGEIDGAWLAQHLTAHGYQEAFARYVLKARRLFALPPEALPLAVDMTTTPAQERRYQTALKMTMSHHYPGLRFRRGLQHLLGVYAKQRLSGLYQVDTPKDYTLAILKQTRRLLTRCLRPRQLALDLRRVLY